VHVVKVAVDCFDQFSVHALSYEGLQLSVSFSGFEQVNPIHVRIGKP
jgi:hypothetical protein